MNYLCCEIFFVLFCLRYELFSSFLFTLAHDSVDYFSKNCAASTSRIQRALASDEKTNLQIEKYKAITANGQNFRHTTCIDDTYISNTLHILTCTSMKEK